jgi:hypothetical protein
MFREPKVSVVLSTRVRKPTAQDVTRAARKKKIPVAEEIRRRLEFYEVVHAKATEPTATAAE